MGKKYAARKENSNPRLRCDGCDGCAGWRAACIALKKSFVSPALKKSLAAQLDLHSLYDRLENEDCSEAFPSPNGAETDRSERPLRNAPPHACASCA